MVGLNKTMISEGWHREGDDLEKLVKYLNLFYFEIRPFFSFSIFLHIHLLIHLGLIQYMLY